MKKLVYLLLVFVGMHADAQKSRVDSLQALPRTLFTSGNILNCTLLGYRRAYEYRFLFAGNKKPFEASLKHEVTAMDGYAMMMEAESFNKMWDYSKDVASSLQNWIFDIIPSRDTFNFDKWVEGINPNGETDRMFVTLPGGRFSIFKELDTAQYKHWKISVGGKPMACDSTWIDHADLSVNCDPSVKQDIGYTNYNIHLVIYNFSGPKVVMGIARWGDLFFPFYYGYRDKKEPQFRLASIQIGFN